MIGRRTCYVAGSAVMTATFVLGAMSSSAEPANASAQSITIKAVLPPGTGNITAADNAGLLSLTKAYEKAHSGVTVEWLPYTWDGNVAQLASVETEAAGGDAPDLVGNQYGSAFPPGLLQNIKPYLEEPNPYVAGNKSWLSLYSNTTVPYMTAANGNIYLVLGSDVETAMIYSKAAFSKAGIASVPTTWAALMTDLAKLKAVGIAPFMFADGGGNPCDEGWYEWLVTSSFLVNEEHSFMVQPGAIATGLDLAVGVEKGIISMDNPSYAAGWKLLDQMKPYFASGASSYNVCSDPNAVTPPLVPNSLLVQGKVAIIWGLTSAIPELNSVGFSGKFGVFPEPTITKATSPYATGTVTKGLIGGPNGVGEWSITSEKADRTMTPAKTKVVMNFLAWLQSPSNLGYWIKAENDGCIPTEPTAPTASIPGFTNLLPTGKVPTGVIPILASLLSVSAYTQGVRLLQEFIGGDVSYSSFASQWQSLLTGAAQTWAQTNHVNLQKYK
jgi:raffinose/stachyose/melibiose transport system substrate-binding protein